MTDLGNENGSQDVVEAEGETVGEAKWTALRELERRFPGLDKAAVRFTVVSEGERGLLGVGRVPAKVIAQAVEPPPAPSAASEEPGTPAAKLREFLEQVCSALGAAADRDRRDDNEAHATMGALISVRDRQAGAHDRRDPVPGQRRPLARSRG